MSRWIRPRSAGFGEQALLYERLQVSLESSTVRFGAECFKVLNREAHMLDDVTQRGLLPGGQGIPHRKDVQGPGTGGGARRSETQTRGDLQAEIKHQLVQRSPVPSFRVCLPQAEANSVADVDQKSFERYEAVTIAEEDAAAAARLVGPGEQPGVVLAVECVGPERRLATVEGGPLAEEELG